MLNCRCQRMWHKQWWLWTELRQQWRLFWMQLWPRIYSECWHVELWWYVLNLVNRYASSLSLCWSAVINECDTNNGGCEQNCDNNEGSFECSCDPGFTLNADMLNCDGMSWNYYNMLAHSLYVELQMSTNVTQTMVVVNRIATTMKALLNAVVTQDLPWMLTCWIVMVSLGIIIIC